MNRLIDDILTEMKIKHGISKYELEKIIDSQFKVLMDTMQLKQIKTVHLKGLGKVKPSTFFIKYKNGEIHKKNKGDIDGSI